LSFVNGFIIISIIYTSPTGRIQDNNDVFSYIQNNAKLYGGEIGLHFHPHPDWLHYETSLKRLPVRSRMGLFAADSS
jgi:iron complex outermembrane receptor protein